MDEYPAWGTLFSAHAKMGGAESNFYTGGYGCLRVATMSCNRIGDGGLVMALCPHCASVVQQMQLETMTIRSADGKDCWKGAAYACPHCYKILGVDIDPALIAAELKRELRSLLSPS
jgi:hypothetical protein